MTGGSGVLLSGLAALLVRAWIEIYSDDTVHEKYSAALLVRAWIEIGFFDKSDNFLIAALLVRAWIEINRRGRLLSPAASRSPRESVD